MADRKCLVGSDEEDEDGNLCEVDFVPRAKDTNKEILPLTEVVYLPSDTACFQPEDVEEFESKPIPVTLLDNNSDDDDVKIIEKPLDPPILIDDDDTASVNPIPISSKKLQNIKTIKVEPSSNENDLSVEKNKQIKASFTKCNLPKSTEISKANHNKTLVSGPKPEIQSNLNLGSGYIRGPRKSKYSRLSTPLCDSIMKDYTKKLISTVTKVDTPSSNINKTSIQGSNTKEVTNNIVASTEKNLLVKNKTVVEAPLKVFAKSNELGSLNSSTASVQSSSLNSSTVSNQSSSLNSSTVSVQSSVQNKANYNLKNLKVNLVRLSPLPKKSTDEDVDPLSISIKTEIKEEIDIEPDVEPISEVFIETNLKSEAAIQYETFTDSTLLMSNIYPNNLDCKEKPTYLTHEMTAPQSNVLQSKRKRKLTKNEEDDDPDYNPYSETNDEIPKNKSKRFSLPSKNQENVQNNITSIAEITSTNAKRHIELQSKPMPVSICESVAQSIEAPQQKRGRGRPPKYKSLAEENPLLSAQKPTLACVGKTSNVQSTEGVVIKKRGRPPKNKGHFVVVQSGLTNKLSCDKKTYDIQPTEMVIKEEEEDRLITTPMTHIDTPLLINEIANTTLVDGSSVLSTETQLCIKQEREEEIITDFNTSTTIKSHHVPNNENSSFPTESQGPQPEIRSVDGKINSIVEKISGIVESDQLPDLKRKTESLLKTTTQLRDSIKLKMSLPSNIEKFNSTLDPSLRSQLTQNPLLAGILINKNNESTKSVNKNNNTIQFQSVHSTDHLNSNQTLNLNSDNSNHRIDFLKDYLKTYKILFNEAVLYVIIPNLSEIVLLCMDDCVKLFERLKKAENITSKKLREQEITLAKLSFAQVVLAYSPKFFPDFSSLVCKMDQFPKINKALLVTLLIFMSTSLAKKSPRFNGEILLLRQVLFHLCKTHKYFHKLVWIVLGMSQEHFNESVKSIVTILTQFRRSNLANVPLGIELFSNSFLSASCDSIQIHSLGNSDSRRNTHHLNHLTPRDDSAPKLSDIAVQFVETLENNRQSDSKRIEGKLDNILLELRKNSEYEISKPGSSKPTQENFSESSIIPVTLENFEGFTIQLPYPHVTKGPGTSKNPTSSEMKLGVGLDHLFGNWFETSAGKSIESESYDCVQAESKVPDVTKSHLLLNPGNSIEFETHFANVQESYNDVMKTFPGTPVNMNDYSKDLDQFFSPENEEDPLSF